MNILTIPELAARCSKPFTPVEFYPITGEPTEPASAQCCTTDITLEEFKSLCGKVDAHNPYAATVEECVGRFLFVIEFALSVLCIQSVAGMQSEVSYRFALNNIIFHESANRGIPAHRTRSCPTYP